MKNSIISVGHYSVLISIEHPKHEGWILQRKAEKRFNKNKYLPKGWELSESTYYSDAQLLFKLDHLPTENEIEQVKKSCSFVPNFYISKTELGEL